MSYWDTYTEVSQKESGGGGIVARARIETGYKVYVKGHDQVDTFFAASAASESEMKTAKASASALGQPKWGIQIRVYRDSAVVRGAPATWQSDRFFNTDAWTDASKEVVVPSLKGSGVEKLPWEGWCRIGFQPDPFKLEQGEAGMTDSDQDGNPRYPQVAYVVEVFADEAAARAALGTQPETASVGGVTVVVPNEDWTPEAWKSVWPDLLKAQKDGKSLAQIAKEWEVTPADVKRAIDAHIPY